MFCKAALNAHFLPHSKYAAASLAHTQSGSLAPSLPAPFPAPLPRPRCLLLPVRGNFIWRTSSRCFMACTLLAVAGSRASGGRWFAGQHQRNCGYFTCRKIKQNAAGRKTSCNLQLLQTVQFRRSHRIRIATLTSFVACAKGGSTLVPNPCPCLPHTHPNTHTTLIPNRKSQFSGKFAGLVITLNHFVFYFPQSVWLEGGEGVERRYCVCLWPMLVFTFLPSLSFVLRYCFWPVFFGPFHKCSHKSAFSLPRIDF